MSTEHTINFILGDNATPDSENAPTSETSEKRPSRPQTPNKEPTLTHSRHNSIG